jgi:hypothetical protein
MRAKFDTNKIKLNYKEWIEKQFHLRKGEEKLKITIKKQESYLIYKLNVKRWN